MQLGRTRAAVLLTVADRAGCTTTELSITAGVSVSTASEHTTVLRQAGLITTTRHHKAVLHTMTPARPRPAQHDLTDATGRGRCPLHAPRTVPSTRRLHTPAGMVLNGVLNSTNTEP